MPRYGDITGQRFGRLVVIALHAKATSIKPRHNTLWLCQCDCGNQRIVDGANWATPRMLSCGCHKREQATKHGHASKQRGVTATFRSWVNMRQRCTNPKNPGYKNWGGRGITVCDRWQTFENFLADMGPMPPRYTIERVDNNGNYEPSNCVWLPKGEQWKTRRRQDRLTKAIPERLVVLLTEWLKI